jgi:hypothetical protein
VLKNGVGQFNIFFYFLHKSCWILLCRYRVESVNIFLYNMCFFQQTISHMRKRFTEWGHCVGHQWSYAHINEYMYMNIMLVYIEFFTDEKIIWDMIVRFCWYWWKCWPPLFKGIQSLRLIFFILKVANIRCFILIAVEIFHNIIRI